MRGAPAGLGIVFEYGAERGKVMRGAKGAICVAGLFLAGMSGCDALPKWGSVDVASVANAVLPALSFAVLAQNGQIYYSASVDATSVSLQNALRGLGLPVSVAQDPTGGVRIASATPDGTHFTMVVKSGQGAGASQQTRVTMEWENSADSQHGFQVLAQLQVQQPKK